MTNTNSVKNQIDAMLEREADGTGRIHYADWLNINFYKELCVEIKNLKGEWENPKGFRNESWDCLVMMQAGLLEPKHVGIGWLDWTDPPGYAREWDSNDLVFDPADQENAIAPSARREYDLRELGQHLA